MTHRRAVLAMLLVTLLWSLAGVVTRQLEHAHSFEVTFWRSLFTALALAGILSLADGPRALLAAIRTGGKVLWLSGLAWGAMFTTFMVAMTLTTVANVLVTMALAPLFAALFARVLLGYRVPPRTALAGLVAGLGIAWMYASELGWFGAGEHITDASPLGPDASQLGSDASQLGSDASQLDEAARHLRGTLVALLVPLSAAANWTLLQHAARRTHSAPPDMRPTVLIGALLSAVVTLPFALPFAASLPDLSWLAFLGVFQLALPCLLLVAIARVLPGPEIALLALLEVVLGVLWAWLGAGEQPSGAVLGGGALVLGALVANEALALRRA